MEHIDYKGEQPLKKEQQLASLLGITVAEFEQLAHSGLQEVTDTEAQIYRYYIQFKESNPAHIMDKLDMDANHIVYFSAEEIRGKSA